jgi:hypothetical protein
VPTKDRPELTDWDITITMARRIDGLPDGLSDERDFTATIPAIDEAAAIRAGYDLGHGINEASGHQWKFTGDNGVYNVTAKPHSRRAFMSPEESDAFAKEIDAHPHANLINALAEATFAAADEDGEGNGGGMLYHLWLARTAADAIAADTDVLNSYLGAPDDPHLTTDCAEFHDLVRDFGGDNDVPPTVTVLCGSTRFSNAFREQNLRLTLAGHIVLSIGCDMRTDTELFAGLTEDRIAAIKADLDTLHLRKIDLAAEVLVLNVDGYIGESTRREIAYATALGKPIRYLEGPF